jgi:diadenosine tetraphosphate (Ap4A) HIT family hydrolase
MNFVDVSSRLEIPVAPPGYRYLDFLGGERELRCFLVDESMPRPLFIEKHSEVLDPALLPIYENAGIYVRQDASYALPGFYVLSFKTQYPSIDQMDAKSHMRASFVVREIRKGMREVLGIDYIHIYYEEKPDLSCNVHFWLLPVRNPRTGNTTVIMRLNLREYLAQFRFSEQKKKILQFNAAMITYIADTKLQLRDCQLSVLLNSLDGCPNGNYRA